MNALPKHKGTNTPAISRPPPSALWCMMRPMKYRAKRKPPSPSILLVSVVTCYSDDVDKKLLFVDFVDDSLLLIHSPRPHISVAIML